MKPITIVGCGPGAARYLTEAAREAVAQADVLVGAPRLLDLFPESAAHRIAMRASVEQVLDHIESALGHTVVVLVSGDPGLCSLARPVVQRLGRERCTVIPGVSSVQAAFAAVGLDWLGATIVSAHGAIPQADVDTVGDRVAVLAGHADALAWAADLANTLGPDWQIILCEDLTLPNERITWVPAADLADMSVASKSIILLIRKALLA